jgi:hypothetical protein
MRTPASPRLAVLAVLTALAASPDGLVPRVAAQTPPPRPQTPDSAPAPPAAKAATFHLPAGDYTIQQLLEQAGQALRQPIALPEELPAGAGPLRLQCDLALPQQAWEEVLGALLSTRKLVLVRNAAGTGHEALPAPDGMAEWMVQRATDMTPRELLDRRGHLGPVRTVLRTTTPASQLTNMMRPLFAGMPRSFTFEAVDGGVRFVGLARQVRFAIELVTPHAPDLAAALPSPARPWPRPAVPGTHRLDAGSYTAAQLLERLARAQNRNLVASAEVAADATPIEVAAAFEGDELRLEERVTALLWTARVLVLDASVDHRIGEALRFEPPSWPHPTRAQRVQPAELLARPELVALVSTVPSVGSLSQDDVIKAYRGARPAAPGFDSLAISVYADGYLLAGLAHQVTAVLQAIETKKAGK